MKWVLELFLQLLFTLWQVSTKWYLSDLTPVLPGFRTQKVLLPQQTQTFPNQVDLEILVLGTLLKTAWGVRGSKQPVSLRPPACGRAVLTLQNPPLKVRVRVVLVWFGLVLSQYSLATS